MHKLLILENNEQYISVYEQTLAHEYRVSFVRSIGELEASIEKGLSIDLFLTSLNLPDGHFLNWVTEKKIPPCQDVPTIIVSATEEYNILASCFEWGASDFLLKPVRQSELKAKVAKALGSFSSSPTPRDLEEILEELTAMERKIFEILFENVGHYVSREDLMPRIWKKVVVHPKTFDVHLSNLRKKLSKRAWSIKYQDPKGWKLLKH